jgi:hypothetical protein
MSFSNNIISHCKAFIKRFFPNSLKKRMIFNYMRKQAVEKRRKVTTKLGFEVSICDHCNLNCVSCEHFSPIADEVFLDIEQYKKNCGRLSELLDGEISWLHLMGGGPVLHPHLIDKLYICIEIAYIKYFNKYFNKKLIVE